MKLKNLLKREQQMGDDPSAAGGARDGSWNGRLQQLPHWLWQPVLGPGAESRAVELSEARPRQGVDPHHQAGLPNQCHGDQVPRRNLSSPCPSRNRRY